jgi:hypothetical protein
VKSHDVARALLALPDLPLLDGYAENTISTIYPSTYFESGDVELDCIVFETEELTETEE